MSSHKVTLLLDSSRGLPPHLTLDMLDSIRRAQTSPLDIQIHLDQLFEMPVFSKEATDKALFEKKCPLTLRHVLRLSDATLWLGCQPESLLASSAAPVCGGDVSERVRLTIATEAGNKIVSDVELVDYMRRLLPHVMIAPMDPSLLSAYVDRGQKTLLLSAGHMNPSFESLCSDVEPSPLNSPVSQSPSSSCPSPLPLSEAESDRTSLTSLVAPFQTSSSRLKYLKRWTTCFERTFKILDTLIAHRPKDTKLFASISTELIRHDHLFPEAHLLSQLAAALASRKDDIHGVALQSEESTDFETQQCLLATLMRQVVPPGLPRSLRLLASQVHSIPLISSFMIEHRIDFLDARFLSRLSNEGKAFILTDRSNVAPIDLHSTLFKNDAGALQSGCLCFSCQNHRKAYIHHLLNTKEMLAQILLSTHNVHTALCYFNQQG